jgi:hypothetical protein
MRGSGIIFVKAYLCGENLLFLEKVSTRASFQKIFSILTRIFRDFIPYFRRVYTAL